MGQRANEVELTSVWCASRRFGRTLRRFGVSFFQPNPSHSRQIPPAENQSRRIFFLLGVSIARILRPKEALGMIFGRVQGLGVGPEVLSDPATIEVFWQRTSVHNMLAYQQIGVPEGAGAIVAAGGHDQLGLLRWVSEGMEEGLVCWVLAGHGEILEVGFAEVGGRTAA